MEMINSEQFNQLARVLPILERANPEMIREFKHQVFYAHIPEGHDVFVEGDTADAIALLISGVVRVYKIGETGREITLYRFGNGESCILTANAILSQKDFPAIATVEKEAKAVMIPAETFRDWVRRYDLWREFVFNLLSERLSSVMEIVEEVAFHRMDERVATFILDHLGQTDSLQITHQAIATELGSSREVISRILEDFSTLGFIHVSRGTITVLDREGLESRSAA